MDVLEFNGKTYVKAATAARELGYTADYVGQLCRGGKVDAQLVGRSWYVDEDSLREHKTARHRSSRTKTREALHDTLTQQDSAPTQQQVTHHAPKRATESAHPFFQRSTSQSVYYDEDPSELIPALTEQERTTNADNESEVHIRTTGEQRRGRSGDTAENAKMGHTGRSRADTGLSSIEDENDNADGATTVHIHTHDTQKPQRRAPRIPLSAADREEGTVALHTKRRQPQGVFDESEVHVPIQTSQKRSRRRAGTATFVYVLGSLTLALAFTASALLVEQEFSSDTTTMSASSYSINTGAALDAIEELKRLK